MLQHRRSWELVEDNVPLLVVAAKRQNASWALLDAGGTADAFRILHRKAFVSEVHHVDSLVADRSANVAGNAFAFVRENPVTRKARVNVHERREWAGKTAPNPAAEPKVKPDPKNAGHEDIDAPGIAQERDALKKLVIPTGGPRLFPKCPTGDAQAEDA